MGKQWKQQHTVFSWASKWLWMVTAAMKLNGTLWKKNHDKPREHIKKQRHYFANKGPSSQSYVFSSSHVWMWELDNKKGWVMKNWCLRTVVLETSQVPWTARWSNQSILKEINPENSLEGLTLKLKLQYFGHLMQRTDSLEKDPEAGKDRQQKEKGATEDEIVR